MADEDGALGTSLGALLQPLLEVIAVREAPPAPPPEPPPMRLDEAELMALIFTHLDDDNPRVCEGIDFSRLEVLVERRPAAPSHADVALDDQPDAELEHPSDAASSIAAPNPDVSADAWIGASWTDDIATIPSEWLDRPQLRPAQHDLLQASRSRPLACVNLRHLGRELALRHLELFVHACRVKRVAHCRVIPGKGVNSRSEPVLKRAVLEWCRGPGRAQVLEWAPELDQHGEYGSVVLRLSAPRASGTTAP